MTSDEAQALRQAAQARVLADAEASRAALEHTLTQIERKTRRIRWAMLCFSVVYIAFVTYLLTR